MTDLEITRLCAEAMGYGLTDMVELPRGLVVNDGNNSVWNPLHDDAQAMALVKKFWLHVGRGGDYWWALAPGSKDSLLYSEDSLNRAICECVAKMQAVK